MHWYRILGGVRSGCYCHDCEILNPGFAENLDDVGLARIQTGSGHDQELRLVRRNTDIAGHRGDQAVSHLSGSDGSKNKNQTGKSHILRIVARAMMEISPDDRRVQSCPVRFPVS